MKLDVATTQHEDGLSADARALLEQGLEDVKAGRFVHMLPPSKDLPRWEYSHGGRTFIVYASTALAAAIHLSVAPVDCGSVIAFPDIRALPRIEEDDRARFIDDKRPAPGA